MYDNNNNNKQKYIKLSYTINKIICLYNKIALFYWSYLFINYTNII